MRRVNVEAEGKTYEPVPFDVEEARVRAFHALFAGPPGVPPTFLTAAEFSVLLDDVTSVTRSSRSTSERSCTDHRNTSSIDRCCSVRP